MPQSVEAVASILLAIVPGYLTLAVWARQKTWQGPGGDLRTVLQALAASAVIQVIAAPLTIAWLLQHSDEFDEFPERVALWALLVTLVLPLLIGLCAGWATNRWGFGVRTAPSVWDWLFGQYPPHGRFVVVQFRDGSWVGGAFAKNAMAVTSPEQQGIYLCPEWEVVDGELTQERPGSGGLMIGKVDDIRWLRVLEPEDDDGQEPE